MMKSTTLASFKSLKTNLNLLPGCGIASELASWPGQEAVSGILLVFSYHDGS